jgi:hypothetical protein
METVNNIPFQTINWPALEKIIHAGETGFALWQTVQLPGLRLRMVEYTAGYFANHWCSKGHIVHCLEGAFTSELKTGETFLLTTGMTYIVSDEMSCHRSVTKTGVKLLIIDGIF